MKVFWRLHKQVLGTHSDTAKRLLESLGDVVQIVEGSYSNLPEVPSHKGPGLIISTLHDVRLNNPSCNTIPWSYYSDQKYKVSYWLPRILKNNLPTLNSDGFWAPAHMLLQKGYIQWPVFVKSDAGHKILTGQTIDDLEQAVISFGSLAPETLLFVSPKLTIDPIEYRFWIVNRKIVASACYSWDETVDVSHPIPGKCLEVAQSVANCTWVPDIAFVVDIVSYQNDYYINEYNCISTSGWYAHTNVEDLLTALREAACCEFLGDLYFEECE